MTAKQYFTQNASANFKYVGTIYGSDEQKMTGAEIADMLNQIGDNPEMVDHPANGGDKGFYLQSNNVHYVGHLVDECVFDRINE